MIVDKIKELSILNTLIIKSSGKIKQNHIQEFEILSNEIKNEIGEFEFLKIIGSDEYKELCSKNEN